MIQSSPMNTLTTIDGLALHLQHWPADPASLAQGPAKGTVQLVHGLGEHVGRYDWLARRLNALGWHVTGHDHRGHGRSGGRRGLVADSHALLADLALVHDVVRGAMKGEGRHVLLGHSLGGLIAARFVAESLAGAPAPWSRPVDRLVLSSPALQIGMTGGQRWLLAAAGTLMPKVAVANGLKPEWISRDPAVVQAYVADPLVHDRITPRLVRFMLEAGERVRAAAPRWRTPTLLLWAGADRCVLPAGSEAFAAAAPAGVVTAQAFPGLAHEIFNEPEREQVFSALRAWLPQD